VKTEIRAGGQARVALRAAQAAPLVGPLPEVVVVAVVLALALTGVVLGAALLFGFASAVAPRLENVEDWASYSTLFSALPYVLTLIAVAGVIGRSIPPAAVGRPSRAHD
jgi:ABC-type uncharacterized transport system permease subunit